MFQVYPGRFHDFFEHSRFVYLFYILVHLFFYVFYLGGLLVYIRTSGVRPLEPVASFADVHDFADAHGFYTVERSAASESIMWALGGILVVLFL